MGPLANISGNYGQMDHSKEATCRPWRQLVGHGAVWQSREQGAWDRVWTMRHNSNLWSSRKRVVAETSLTLGCMDDFFLLLKFLALRQAFFCHFLFSHSLFKMKISYVAYIVFWDAILKESNFLCINMWGIFACDHFSILLKEGKLGPKEQLTENVSREVPIPGSQNSWLKIIQPQNWSKPVSMTNKYSMNVAPRLHV